MTKTQIDKLGERLKAEVTEADLRLLDEYRLSYAKAYDKVVSTIKGELGLSPTGRPAKSTKSIVDKLRRESIRLTQMQDIAGCRLIVEGLLEQDTLVESLLKLLPNGSVVDRREKPSFGYRAVHFIAKIESQLIEIQIRTKLQHRWAEFSEKVSDTIDPAIKYGAGRKEIQESLGFSSSKIADLEASNRRLANTIQISGAANLYSIELQDAILDAKNTQRIAENLLDQYFDKTFEYFGVIRREK